MSKKIKLVAIIETEDNAVIDDSAIENSVGSLGVVKSYNISLDDANESDNKSQESGISTDSSSEVAKFIKDSNKIYYGNLSLKKGFQLQLLFYFQLIMKKLIKKEILNKIFFQCYPVSLRFQILT